MPDLRLGNVLQLPSRRISRRWTRSGKNLVFFSGALCAQTNLFWREMKIKKMYLKSNTRQENFRTFEERDILRCFDTVFQRRYRYFSIALKVIFSLSDRYKIFTSNWLWIEICENVVLNKIDITMTTINKKL